MSERQFPVHPETRRRHPTCPKTIPWSLLTPHEEWALRNHSQSLERLAQRGGLGAGEIRCVVEGRKLFSVPHGSDEAEAEHVKWLIGWLCNLEEANRRG